MKILDWFKSLFSKKEETTPDSNVTSDSQQPKIPEINFTGKKAVNQNSGINFQAEVNGNLKICSISLEAMQDEYGLREPSNIMATFEANEYSIHQIAEKKIIANPTQEKFYITTSDFVS